MNEPKKPVREFRMFDFTAWAHDGCTLKDINDWAERIGINQIEVAVDPVEHYCVFRHKRYEETAEEYADREKEYNRKIAEYKTGRRVEKIAELKAELERLEGEIE